MELKVESVILVYAFRYALGRFSGSVIDVINNIMSNIDKIDEKYKAIMAAETLKYLHDAGTTTPADIILSWKNLVIELYKHITPESQEWISNPLGGGVDKMFVEFQIKEN